METGYHVVNADQWHKTGMTCRDEHGKASMACKGCKNVYVSGDAFNDTNEAGLIAAIKLLKEWID